jgi:ABC-type dipeptide/oligopeptide/nickel transport system permease subunit
MLEATAGIPLSEPVRPRARVWSRLRKRPVALVAIAVIVVIYGAGILAPVITPYGFNEADFKHTEAAPSWDHPLGTDSIGRDLLSRAIWSAQTTVIISVATVTMGALALGVTLGLLSGYLRGWADAIIMRVAEIMGSVPTILLLLIITATFLHRVEGWAEDLEGLTGVDGIVSSGAPSYFLVFGALSLFSWVGIARIVRSQVLSLRESQYVIAARASGASTWRIVLRHLLPNVSNLLIVALTLSLGGVAGAEIGLTFLGIGVQQPHPSFGAMIFEGAGLTQVRQHPMLIAVPGTCVVSLTLAFNLLGDQLTDILSPRRR